MEKFVKEMTRLDHAVNRYENILKLVPAIFCGLICALILWFAEGHDDFSYIWLLLLICSFIFYVVLRFSYGFNKTVAHGQIKEYFKTCVWLTARRVNDDFRHDIKMAKSFEAYIDVARHLKTVIETEELIRRTDPESQHSAPNG
jgi:hypothetical protein